MSKHANIFISKHSQNYIIILNSINRKLDALNMCLHRDSSDRKLDVHIAAAPDLKEAGWTILLDRIYNNCSFMKSTIWIRVFYVLVPLFVGNFLWVSQFLTFVIWSPLN